MAKRLTPDDSRPETTHSSADSKLNALFILSVRAFKTAAVDWLWHDFKCFF